MTHALMAENEEELKSLLIMVKEQNEGAGIRLNVKKKKQKLMTSDPIIALQIEGENVEVVTDFLFLGSKITADSDCSREIR